MDTAFPNQFSIPNTTADKHRRTINPYNTDIIQHGVDSINGTPVTNESTGGSNIAPQNDSCHNDAILIDSKHTIEDINDSMQLTNTTTTTTISSN